MIAALVLALLLVAAILLTDIAVSIHDDRLPRTEPPLPDHLAAAYRAAPALRYLPGWQPDPTPEPREDLAALWQTALHEAVLGRLSHGPATPAAALLCLWWLPAAEPAGLVRVS